MLWWSKAQEDGWYAARYFTSKHRDGMLIVPYGTNCTNGTVRYQTYYVVWSTFCRHDSIGNRLVTQFLPSNRSLDYCALPKKSSNQLLTNACYFSSILIAARPDDWLLDKISNQLGNQESSCTNPPTGSCRHQVCSHRQRSSNQINCYFQLIFSVR